MRARLSQAGRTAGKLALRSGSRLLLCLVEISLRRLGYRRTWNLLRTLSPEPPVAARHRARALQVGVTVNHATRAAERDNACLRRTLVAWYVLRWLRIPTDVRFGVAAKEGRTLAHAWLEHDGFPVNDGPHIADAFPITHSGDLLTELSIRA